MAIVLFTEEIICRSFVSITDVHDYEQTVWSLATSRNSAEQSSFHIRS